jgi:hypothetical protein
MAKKTPMPIIAGILSIVAGSIEIIGFGVFLIGSAVSGWNSVDVLDWIPGLNIGFGIGLTLELGSLLVGGLAVAGGIMAVQRKQWGWALAGAIGAVLSTFVLGVAALVLTALSKKEFEELAPENGQSES